MAIALPYFQSAPDQAAAQRARNASQQSPQQAALEAQLVQTPEWAAYQHALAQGYSFGSSPEKRALDQRARALGMSEDTIVGISGGVQDKSWIEKHPVLYAALVTGGVVGGGLAVASLAGAGGGVAAGETAATVPSATSVGAAGMGGGAPVLAAGGAASGAASSAPAWLSAGAWQGAALNTGLNAVGTILDNRGRQQAAETLANASERAGQNSLEATRLSIDAANQARSAAAPYLQNPGYYQQGSTTPTPYPSFAQMGSPGASTGRVGTEPVAGGRASLASQQTPQGFTDSYLSTLPTDRLQTELGNPTTPEYGQQLQAEMARRQQGGSGQAAPTGAYLQQLLSSGMNPQEAVAKFNSDTGRTTGNEAVLYGAEVHGRPTIGLPGSYLSLEGNGWQETQRTPEAPNGNLRGGGMPSFAQMGMNSSYSQGGPPPQLQPPPGAYQPVSFANLLTVQRPQYLPQPFVPPAPGRRM